MTAWIIPGPAVGLMGALMSGAAHAGGYVAPIVAAPPVAVAAEPSRWWIALPLLALLALAGRSSGSKPGITPLPGDYGGPCFGEGTGLRMADGTWKAVEDIAAGDTIWTSEGKQAVIATDSWVPTDFRDRPVIVNGVRLSPNHGVKHDDAQRVEAIEASRARGMIDGRAYHHVLVAEHSWLLAWDGEGQVFAESLWLTKDMKLGRAYPEIAARHAAVNLGGVEVAA